MSKRVITLGTWDGNPIEWIVLKNEGLSTLCISKNVVFFHSFNDNSNKGTSYAKSDIRKYLNSEFFTKAFTDVEKKKIINVNNTDSNTKDNIFLLSKAEVESLMTNNERICGSWWYTRTPADNSSIYDHKSDQASFGSYLTDQDGIRPAVWIKE